MDVFLFQSDRLEAEILERHKHDLLKLWEVCPGNQTPLATHSTL